MVSDSTMLTHLPAIVPPTEGFITVPELLEFHYKHNPDFPVYVFRKHGDDRETEVTFLEFIRASNRVARIVRPDVSNTKREVVAVVALADTLVYEAIIAGIMKAGLIPLLISPRNTPAAVVHLLKKTNAHRLLTTQSTLKDLLDGVKMELASPGVPPYDVTFEEAPMVQEVFPKLGNESAEDPFEPYPSPAISLAPNDIGLFLHSSGSTGFPKAIPLTHLTIMHWAAFPSLTELRDHQPVLRLGAMPLPPFHALSVHVQFLCALFGGISIALYPPTVTNANALPVMPTPESVLKHAQLTRSNAFVIVPSFLQIWAQSPSDVEVLRSLEIIAFAGGPLAPATGDYLVSCGVRLRSMYGGTEFGIPTKVDISGSYEDWAWHSFSDRVNIRWVPQGDGTYENHFLTVDTHSVSVENLPDVRGYATSDLWERHPTKEHLWKIVGRIDDVLIHSSGEKTVPAPVENIVMKSPFIKGAIMFGRQRDQPGILIEPSAGNEINVHDDAEVSRFRNKIWSVIEEGNHAAPAFSRIYKEMILIASVEKPLPRAPKGTVMRKAAILLYDKEIDQIYDAVESNTRSGSGPPPSSWAFSDVELWLSTQVADLCGRDVAPSDDMFEHGMDSLSATILRLRLVSALRASDDPSIQSAARKLAQDTVYQHPTINDLAIFITSIVRDPNQTKTGERDHETAIEEMIRKYSVGLEIPISSPQYSKPEMVADRSIVLLTGSTGSLGAQLLASLLSNKGVERVYSLNRPSSRTSILDRHMERFEDKALDINLLSSPKLVFLEGESSKPNFGLSNEIIDKLKDDVTLIIHNAWRLDFNLSLSSFESNIRGVRGLIDLARSSRNVSTLRFLFTSSIAAAQSWDAKENGLYPNEVISDAKYAVGAGYGESKYVSERIIARSGLRASSIRIGQIAGGKPNGAWAMSDWFPMIIKSSLSMNMLPMAHGVVSWVPMDVVADAILDVAFTARSLPTAINLVHPRPISWSYVMEHIRNILLQLKGLDPNSLPLIPLQDWFSALQQFAADTPELASKVPAIKIMDFIKHMCDADEYISKWNDTGVEAVGLTPLNTTDIQQISSGMQHLEEISFNDITQWIDYWARSGL